MIIIMRSIIEWFSGNISAAIISGILVPILLLVLKAILDNYNNTRLEAKLSTNFTQFAFFFMRFCTLFIIYFILILLLTNDSAEKGEIGLYLAAVIIIDLAATVLAIFLTWILIYLLAARFDYYMIDNGGSKWKLIKNNSKRGAMFKRVHSNVPIHMFMESLDQIELTELKREKPLMKWLKNVVDFRN